MRRLYSLFAPQVRSSSKVLLSERFDLADQSADITKRHFGVAAVCGSQRQVAANRIEPGAQVTDLCANAFEP